MVQMDEDERDGGSVKSRLLGIALIGVGMVVIAALPRPQTTVTAANTVVNNVVVELFTSEGCSSCPPADELLARIGERQPITSVHLIAMEEHVDYWNEQGWNDRFSSSEMTERQRRYASVLKNGNPYTPQMVVDGTLEFVGSHGQQAQESIVAESRRIKTPVALEESGTSGKGQESFSVKIGKLESPSKGDVPEVWMAITETGLHSAVTGGENAGHELRHAAIVRWFYKIGEAKDEGETSFAGTESVSLQRDWKRENLRAVALVQEKKSRRILGAAEMPIAGH